MKPVFIGGSRAISRLNAAVCERLDTVLERGHPIFVGDANGADKAVQKYLAKRGHPEVTVFCTERCRNNLGNWPVRVIHCGRNVRDFAFYAAKDRAMAAEAGCGIMLWDGASRGTLENVVELLRRGKKVLLYTSPTRVFRKLESEADLSEATARPAARPARRSRTEPGAPPPGTLRFG